MQRLRVLTPLLGAVLAGAAAFASVPGTPDTGASEPPAASPARVEAGSKIPPLKLSAIQPGQKQPTPLEIAAKGKPLVVCYLRIGESLGEEGLLSVQSLVSGPLKGKVDLLGATNPGTKVTVPALVDRLSLLGVTVPFVLDDDLQLGRMLSVTSAPSMALIDGAGTLRVMDAKSLKQQVVSGVTLKEAIEKAARGEQVPTVPALARYYPANELVGEPFPDFMLKKFESTERVKMSEVVARDKRDKKVPAIFFWHPNCPHCKKAMPSIMVGYRAYGKWLDLISIVDLKNADEIRNAEDTIKAHGVTFPVLQDEDRRISDLYRVVSTPTFVFLKPDGVVESVYTSGDVNYVTIFQAKVKALVGATAGKPPVK